MKRAKKSHCLASIGAYMQFFRYFVDVNFYREKRRVPYFEADFRVLGLGGCSSEMDFRIPE